MEVSLAKPKIANKSAKAILFGLTGSVSVFIFAGRNNPQRVARIVRILHEKTGYEDDIFGA